MRLIDADKLKEDVLSWGNCYNGYSDAYDKAMIIDEIDEQPTADTERHGHWIGIDDEPCETYECDKCGYITEEIGCNNGIPNNFNYCPRCGALMEEVEE